MMKLEHQGRLMMPPHALTELHILLLLYSLGHFNDDVNEAVNINPFGAES